MGGKLAKVIDTPHRLIVCCVICYLNTETRIFFLHYKTYFYEFLIAMYIKIIECIQDFHQRQNKKSLTPIFKVLFSDKKNCRN